MSEASDWQTLLDPFAWVVYELGDRVPAKTVAAALRGMLRSRSDDEIRSIVAACKEPTETNCWWAIYQAAQLLPRAAEQVLRDRGWGAADEGGR